MSSLKISGIDNKKTGTAKERKSSFAMPVFLKKND